MIPRAALLPAAAVCAAALVCAVAAAPASAATYLPPHGKVFAGLTGGTSITAYEGLTGFHPPVFERFIRYDTGTKWLAVQQSAYRTRIAVALSTAIAKYKRGVVSPKGIATGRSDHFLIEMNENIAHSHRIVYVRIMPEMNGWWNPYCPWNKNGSFRGRAFSQHFFIEAWRRTVLILRGGSVSKIDHTLRAQHLPPIKHMSKRAVLPRPKVSFMWVPMTRGDPETTRNMPARFWPGSRYVDWVGTDFFSMWRNWQWLTPFYRQFAHKPFLLAEWGMLGRDDPKFIRQIFYWVRKHPRVRMLNYYQGYTLADPYNPIHYPKAMRMLSRELISSKFPQYAPEYQPPALPRPAGGHTHTSPPPPSPPGGHQIHHKRRRHKRRRR